MFQKIIKFSIYVLVFLMPLFWLPFSFEAFEFNKGYLLFFLVSIGILAWLAKMIFQDKEIRFRRTPIDLFVLGFLVIMIFSALLRQDKISSLLGFYGRFWPSLIGILSLGGFYFLLTNNVQSKEVEPPKEVRPRPINIGGLLKVFLWSAFFVVLISYFSLFGFWTMLSSKIALPFVIQLRIFNPIGGSLEALVMFLAFVSVLIIGILAFRPFYKVARSPQVVEKRRRSLGLYVLLFASLFILVMVDFWASWLVIFLSLVTFLVFSFWKRIFREDVNRLSLSILFLIISLVFLFSNPLQNLLQQSPTLGNLPREVLLSQGTSWDASWQGLKENPVLGSGMSTFHYVFSKFKPQSFLESTFWQLRFDRAGNHITEVIGTTGILGILSYFALIGMFLMISLVIVGAARPPASSTTPGVISPLLIGFVALLIAQFVYYQNTTLAFGFWLFLGLAVVSWGPRNVEISKYREFSFKDFPEVGLIFSVIFWVVLFGFLFCYFNMAKFYLADVHYRNYLVNPAQNLERLEKAARLADSRATYHIVLARAYLGKFAEEASKPQPNNQVIGNMVALAVQEAKRAVELSPNRVASQETLGVVYRDIQGVAQGALEWGIKSFAKAIELEPKNPVLLTELGKLQVINNKLAEARDLFKRALEMREDYVDAALQLSILDENEGRTGEAIGRMEDLVRNNPFSVEAHFQLGRLYYNQKEYDKAISQFQSAILLFPNHSNSHYSLGLIYERQGEKEKALREFEKVLELNPDNQDVMRKIEELKE